MSPGRVGRCSSCLLDDEWRSAGRRDALADVDRETRRRHLQDAHRDRRAELYSDAYVAGLVERTRT